MQIGQIPKIYLGKAEPVIHTPEKTEIEKLSRHAADLLLNESLMIAARVKRGQKSELESEINDFKNLFHPAGKLSKVRNMSKEEIIKLTQKIIEGRYRITKSEEKKITIENGNIKELVNIETAAHAHDVIVVTTKVYLDRKEKGEEQIKLLIDDIDGMEI